MLINIGSGCPPRAPENKRRYAGGCEIMLYFKNVHIEQKYLYFSSRAKGTMVCFECLAFLFFSHSDDIHNYVAFLWNMCWQERPCTFSSISDIIFWFLLLGFKDPRDTHVALCGIQLLCYSCKTNQTEQGM